MYINQSGYSITLFLCKSEEPGHGISTRGENKDEWRGGV